MTIYIPISRHTKDSESWSSILPITPILYLNIENDEELFLKTIIPSRKATQKYLGEKT